MMPGFAYNSSLLIAGVAELADAPDSKSGSRKRVWVRFPPPASANTKAKEYLNGGKDNLPRTFQH